MPPPPIPLLILALAAAMAPLVFHLPPWAVAWCGLCWGYLLVQHRQGWPAPTRPVRIAIFVAGMAAVLLSAGLRLDGGDFITLLAVMAGIKPMEVHNRRDSMIALFLAYFLVIASLFVFETLSMTLYLFVSVWITTGVLIHVNHPTGRIRPQMALASRLLLVAIPLMILLFLLFPRLSGSFWGAPWSGVGRSGFSSILRIGDVSRLALVDEPAFSVSFDSSIPGVEQLYWRGIVFGRFDGRTWHPDRSRRARHQPIAGSHLTRYAVILEPHGYRHLFVLDLPVAETSVATIMDDHTLVARRSVRQRLHYSASSFLDFRDDRAAAPGSNTLQLPPGRNPRAVDLGRQWARMHDSAEAVVDAALAFFRDNGFVYTLQPDRLGRDAVDDFLFTSRKGFCEHFASAFTVLMRAAGVPSRIVGGYQGGQWNALGGFFTVRQSDAHAWCEVWLSGKGWVRVDPTFAVAPERIDLGLEDALSGSWLPDFLKGGDDSWLRWTETLQLTWEAVNTRWNMWFMGFSAEDQIVLLKRLGLHLGRLGGWLLVLVLPPAFLAVLILSGRLRRRMQMRRKQDDALIIYNRFLRKMSRAGLPKADHQGPLDFAGSAARRLPTHKPEIEAITERYVRLRYGRDGSNRELQGFRRSVQRFRPRPGSVRTEINHAAVPKVDTSD
jgi:transglutaminase-like putative cysteine protease